MENMQNIQTIILHIFCINQLLNISMAFYILCSLPDVVLDSRMSILLLSRLSPAREEVYSIKHTKNHGIRTEPALFCLAETTELLQSVDADFGIFFLCELVQIAAGVNSGV